jgi:hypothetical protein
MSFKNIFANNAEQPKYGEQPTYLTWISTLICAYILGQYLPSYLPRTKVVNTASAGGGDLCRVSMSNDLAMSPQRVILREKQSKIINLMNNAKREQHYLSQM